MYIIPAIDLYEGKAVRLLKGDYNKMTVYSDNPAQFAADFEKSGAKFLHIVDLEGAKTGETPNINVVEKIVKDTNLFVEVGGGIRSMEIVEKYLGAGVGRVILGTAAVTNPEFLEVAVRKYKEKIAVGIDVLDGFVAIRGWTEKSAYTCEEFFEKMQNLGVKTIICTDISKDGVMQGTNRELYKELSKKFNMDIVASGGVSTLDDVEALKKMNLYGAIIGKAYYIGAVKIEDAVKIAQVNQ